MSKAKRTDKCTCADGVRGKGCFDYHGSTAPKDKGVKRYDLGQVVSIGTDKDFCKTEMVGVTEGKYVLYSDIEPVLKENEELQAHKDGTLDGDCQVCDYDSFHRLLKDKDAEIASQNRKIEWLQDQVKELEENLFKCQGFLLEADKKLAAYDSGMAQNNAVQHIAKESRY
jgi:hypothetical protein